MQITLIGASGFIGHQLAKQLVNHHTLTALELNPHSARSVLPIPMAMMQWDVNKPDRWKDTVQQADCVINLAGAPLFSKRWTNEYKQLLRSSRINTTRAIVDILRERHRPDAALINASAVGYYGDTSGKEVDESAPFGHGFLAQVCKEWEAEAARAKEFGIRVVQIRSGIVLGNGGMLKALNPWLEAKIALSFGSGQQHLPWIHIDDEVGLIKLAIENKNINGPINAVAPDIVTMQQFSHELKKSFKCLITVPIPAVMLKMVLGEGASVLLTDQKIAPHIASKHGYKWNYSLLTEALRKI